MNLFQAFIQLRYRQLIRIIQELGILRTVIVTVLIGVTLLESIKRLESDSQSIIFIILGWITVFSAHIYRQDKDFFKAFQTIPSLLLLAEYAVYSLPFIVVLFAVKQFIFAGVYLLGVFMISWIPYTVNTKGKAVPIPFISAIHYEMIAGLRRVYFILIILYLAGIFLAQFTATIPIVIFILTSLFVEFNLHGEPQEFLDVLGLSPRQFLWSKITYQLYFFMLSAFPLGILFMIFHTEYWWIILPILLYAMLLIVLFVLSKYHFYRPNVRITEPSVFNMLFLYGGFFVPVLIPLVIPLSIFFMVRAYRKAVQNLESYIIDY